MGDEEILVWLEGVISAASERARALSAHGQAGFEAKGERDYVSCADREVETFIRAAVQSRFPHHGIVGEESGGALDAREPTWVIDPIDGTTNFIRGLPLWAISIGLVREGRFAIGAVALPAFSQILSAREGGGLRVNGAPAMKPHRAGARLMGLGENLFEPALETERRAQACRDEGYSVLRLGSAVFALASAALGKLDGYVERGCRLWDVAAADVVCREAGLLVKTSDLGGGFWAIEARWGEEQAGDR